MMFRKDKASQTPEHWAVTDDEVAYYMVHVSITITGRLQSHTFPKAMG